MEWFYQTPFCWLQIRVTKNLKQSIKTIAKPITLSEKHLRKVLVSDSKILMTFLYHSSHLNALQP